MRVVLSVIRCAVRRASKQAMATGNSKQADRQGGDWRGGEGDVVNEGNVADHRGFAEY